MCADIASSSRLALAGQAPCARPLLILGRAPRMLWTILVILLALWLLGIVAAYTLGGFIHILLVVAIVMVLIRLIQGRRGTA